MTICKIVFDTAGLTNCRILKILSLVIILLIPGIVKGQSTLEQEIDSVFQSFTDTTPGIAFSLIHNGQVVTRKSFGKAHLEYDIPVDSTTVFHIASDSKRFTALSILLLEERNRLKLSDDIRNYLPDFPNLGAQITIQHLLNHTSGLRDQWQLLGMAGWRMEDIVTQEHILKILYNQEELNFNPNDEFTYCNSGYTLLAEIVAVVSGLSFSKFVQKNIFEPLNMDNSHFHMDHTEIVPNRSYSYSNDEENEFKKEILNFANGGATGLFTTVVDLEKWVINRLSKNPIVGSTEIFGQMHKKVILNSGEEMIYGMGEMTLVIDDKTLIGHGGNDAGFNSFVGYYPDYDIGIVALSNWQEQSSGNLAITAAQIYLQKLKNPKKVTADKVEKLEVEPKIIESKSSTLNSQAGVFETIWGRVDIKVDDNGLLFRQNEDEDFQKFKPISNTSYYNKEEGLTLTFSELKESLYYKFKVTGPNNTNFSANRIFIVAYSNNDLKQFTGTFTSKELQTTYTIVLEKDQLVAKHRRHSDIPLNLKSKNRFTGDLWYFGLIEFLVDDNGLVTEFLLSGGRGRAANVRFIKF